jgi:hypothetical protein
MPAAYPVTERRRPGAPRVAATVAAAAIAAVLIAACGGRGSSPGVANISNSRTSTSQSSSTPGGGGGLALGGGAPSNASGGQSSALTIAGGSRQSALKYSACMRASGVPSFPDPNGQGVIQFGSSDGIDPRSAAFQKAQQKCAKYQGGLGGHAPTPAQQAKAQAAALAFSQCMRNHGEPDFPDPQFRSGGISIKISAPGSPGGSSSLDPNSPIFQRAQKACRSLIAAR